MELKVRWTNLASEQLADIFDFYKTTDTIAVARKIVKALVVRTAALPLQPQQGQQELLLSDRSKEFRNLVEGNYKIIYWVEPLAIFIAAVIDTRQNPVKIEQVK